jgi:hypothetical protein
MEEVPALPLDILELGRSLIPRPVFLIGCARSGTSILGEALAAHPQVDYLFEASAIWNELVPPRGDHRLTARDAAPEAARAIILALAKSRDALPRTGADDAKEGNATDRILLEKNPKHVIRIPFLRALFPQARFIHIIRDGRDTAASLMFRNRGPNWGHLETPGWRELLERYPTANHVRCAHQWRDSVLIARADARDLPPGSYREVRYEGLLEDAAGTIGSLLEFLALAPNAGVDAFLPKIQDATEGSYHAKRQVRHYVENHSRRVGRWRENLADAQVAEVEAVEGDLLRDLGYL